MCACADRGPGIAGAGALAAAPSQAQPVLVLHDPNVSLDLQAQGLAWGDADADAKAKASIALLMVRAPCGSNAHDARLDRVCCWTALAGPILALLFVVIDRGWGVRLIGVYLTLCAVLGLVTAFLASRQAAPHPARC